MDGMQWLAVIAALERTLARRLPERSAQWGALLNALAVHVEPRGADARVVEAVVQALRALLDGGGVDLRQGDLEAQLTAVAGANPCWPAPDPSPAFSLGPNAIAEVAYFRYHLGLSVAHVHRHFTQHLGVRMPAEALLQCVALVGPPATPSAPTLNTYDG